MGYHSVLFVIHQIFVFVEEKSAHERVVRIKRVKKVTGTIETLGNSRARAPLGPSRPRIPGPMSRVKSRKA
jgi:hypothetical protein